MNNKPLSVTEATVARNPKVVSTSRAGGPDNLPSWVPKEYADILAPLIAYILNTSFLECRVPHVWKLADVPPLPKAPTICDFIKDLRPISLASTLSKIAEGIVIEKVLKQQYCHLLTLLNLVSFQVLQLPLLLYRCSTTGCAPRTGMAQLSELLS